MQDHTKASRIDLTASQERLNQTCKASSFTPQGLLDEDGAPSGDFLNLCYEKAISIDWVLGRSAAMIR